MIKKITIILSLTLFLIFLSYLTYLKNEKPKDYLRAFNLIEYVTPQIFHSTIKMWVNNKTNNNRIQNDYNKVFLPETQYVKLDFKKISLSFLKKTDVGYTNVFSKKPFYIDIYKKYLFVMSKNNNLYYKLINELYDESKKFKKINLNIKTNDIKDIYIDQNHIYVSYVKVYNNCKYLYLAKAKINLENLIFQDIFDIKDECMGSIQAGRIQKITKKNIPYILLATSADSLKNDDEKDSKPQSEKSLYGKIIAINDKDYSFKIYTKGHRNILGLTVTNNTILATENGPFGGDEINIISENKNYGWDIASTGKKYRNRNDSNINEYLDHASSGFEEPIFSFIPSLGISEIIKIDDKFHNDWNGNFLIGTLNNRHLFRVKINILLKKIDYFEEIYIGERIRDLKYSRDNSIIIMALEDSGSIGILKKIN
tara:strand:+ start:210 stop:1487 length:1278 start_codon:yes stop_codon:yes gene_type:complete